MCGTENGCFESDGVSVSTQGKTVWVWVSSIEGKTAWRVRMLLLYTLAPNCFLAVLDELSNIEFFMDLNQVINFLTVK